MEEIIKIESIAQYNKIRGAETLHPLVAVTDLSKTYPMPEKTFNFGVYVVYLKELNCGELKYGRNHYDYQEGTLVFIAPGQVLGVERKEIGRASCRERVEKRGVAERYEK